MSIREEILHQCNGEIHPETIYAKLAHLANRDTIQLHLCLLVQDGKLDADAIEVETMDGNLVTHVHMIYGRMDKRMIGFTA